MKTFLVHRPQVLHLAHGLQCILKNPNLKKRDRERKKDRLRRWGSYAITLFQFLFTLPSKTSLATNSSEEASTSPRTTGLSHPSHYGLGFLLASLMYKTWKGWQCVKQETEGYQTLDWFFWLHLQEILLQINVIVLTDVHVAEGHYPWALLKMGGLQHKEERQVVVSQFQVHLIYAQDLLSKDPEIHQLFTYKPHKGGSELHPNLAPSVVASRCRSWYPYHPPALLPQTSPLATPLD